MLRSSLTSVEPLCFLSRAPLGTVGPYTTRVGVGVDTYHTSAIPHPFRCAAAAVRLYTVICSSVSVSHPSFYHIPKHTLWLFVCVITPPYLSHPQTHAVGVRTRYHTPLFITPTWDRCELHFIIITGGTKYITPPTAV